MKLFQIHWGLYCYLIVLKLLHSAHAQGNDGSYYMVTSAGSIFSGRPYGVVVSIFNSTVSCSCEVYITGPSLNMSIQMHLTPHDPIRSYRFEVPEIPRGAYYLNVKSTRGLSFKNRTQLSWHNFKNFIKIQTPKTHYRPGQLVQFRVFFHNETMNAVQPEHKATIWIEDARSNRVTVYKSFQTIKGIFQSSFRLSRIPNLGRWRICAQNGLYVIEECAYIRVTNYVLPAFKVKISAPNEVSLKTDQHLQIIITASYGIDTPVEGKLSFQINTYLEVAVPHKPLMMGYRKQFQNGQSIINVTLSEFESRMQANLPLQLKLTATVYEKYTEKFIITSRKVTIWNDNTNDAENGNTVNLRVPKPKPFHFENRILIDYGRPTNTRQIINFQLDYKLEHGICVVLFNGLILAAQQVFPDASNNFRIDIQFTLKMWPFVHIFLYGMESESKVLLVATQTVTVARSDHTHVNIEAPTLVTPGEEITLRINAVARSYVGLIGVDNRVFQLQDWSNNDFTGEYFDVVKFAIRASAPDIKQNEQLTPHRLGMITLTNADLVSDAIKTEKIDGRCPYWREPKISTAMRAKPVIQQMVRAPIEKPLEDTSRHGMSRLRDESDDVWLYESILNTQPGWTNLTTRVPQAVTSWRVSAFSIDPSVGLTLLMPEPFITIKSIKPVLIYVSVPYSIRVGEILNIKLICFNQLPKDREFTVGLQQNASYFRVANESQILRKLKYIEMPMFISSNSSNVTHFDIRAIRPGSLTLNFTAKTETLQSYIVTQIEVLPNVTVMPHQEVVYQQLNGRPRYIDFSLKLLHPHDTNGVKCYVSGKLFADRLRSLSSIEPMDNTEQLISKLMSMYYLWKYGKDQSWMGTRWKQFLEDQLIDGFQSLLRQRGKDGGFTYNGQKGFGAVLGCSSTWITAYALQLLQLLEGIPLQLDYRFQLLTEKFLLSRRQDNEQFVEPCETPGRRKLEPLELSIEVLKVLQQSKRMLDLQTSHRWISENMETNKTFHLEAKRALDILKWKKPIKDTANWMEYRLNLETASRILILQLQRKRAIQHEIFHWLIAQLYGEYSDVYCYESSVAVQAIHLYMSMLSVYTPQLNIQIWGDPENHEEEININSRNQWLVHLVPLQVHNQTIHFKAEGLGELLVRCSYDYVATDQSDHNYQLDVKQLQETYLLKHQLKMECCVQRNGLNREYYVGSELVLELPSGYEFNLESINKLLTIDIVKQADLSDKNSKLFVKLTALEADKLNCLTVLSRRNYRLMNLQDATLSAYDTNSLGKVKVFGYKVTFSNSTAF